jgi:hypothetical protein
MMLQLATAEQTLRFAEADEPAWSTPPPFVPKMYDAAGRTRPEGVAPGCDGDAAAHPFMMTMAAVWGERIGCATSYLERK